MHNRRFKFSSVAKYGDISEAQARYAIGKSKVREIAAAAGATVKIGRVTRYNFEIMDAYIEASCGKSEPITAAGSEV